MIKDQMGFDKSGNWYKGNLHSHTTSSDGRLTPEEAVELYKENGYSFLCFSEHDLYTDRRDEFDCEDFIILPGLEASVILCEKERPGRRLKVHHIHGILGTEEMQRAAGAKVFEDQEFVEPEKFYGTWDGAGEAQRLCDYLRSRGCITVYNHPVWSRVEPEEFIHTEGLWALEIFNYNTVNESNTGYDCISWDRMLRGGKNIGAAAADDNHNEGIFDDACGGFIMVRAEKLTHEDILQNMIKGNYYSSAGPEIYGWGIENGAAWIECSPVYRIDFIVGNHINDGRSLVCRKCGETLQRGEYALRGDEDYIRIQVSDKYGRTAWTNAIYGERGKE